MTDKLLAALPHLMAYVEHRTPLPKDSMVALGLAPIRTRNRVMRDYAVLQQLSKAAEGKWKLAASKIRRRLKNGEYQRNTRANTTTPKGPETPTCNRLNLHALTAEAKFTFIHAAQ